MKRFQDILCVLNDRKSSKIALQRAVSLALNNQARLKVIIVTTAVSIGMGMPEHGPISEELQAVNFRERANELDSLLEPFRGQMKIHAEVLIGVQFLEIIRQVLRNGHDLVIKAPESEDWLDHLLGSEDMHLLRKCPCPVWLIKPSVQKTFRRIFAAIDVGDVYPADEMKTRRKLNQHILEMAYSLALADSAELHIVHAWQAVGERAMRGSLLKKRKLDVDDYINEVRQQRRANLNQLLQTVSGDLGPDVIDNLKPQHHLVKGRARREIPALVRKLEADLVVMGTVARTGIPGFFTGNTAESILGQMDCSVLAIKPPGFKSPVTLV